MSLFVCCCFFVSFITSKCFLGNSTAFVFKYDPFLGLLTSMNCLYRNINWALSVAVIVAPTRLQLVKPAFGYIQHLFI